MISRKTFSLFVILLSICCRSPETYKQPTDQIQGAIIAIQKDPFVLREINGNISETVIVMVYKNGKPTSNFVMLSFGYPKNDPPTWFSQRCELQTFKICPNSLKRAVFKQFVEIRLFQSNSKNPRDVSATDGIESTKMTTTPKWVVQPCAMNTILPFDHPLDSFVLEDWPLLPPI